MRGERATTHNHITGNQPQLSASWQQRALNNQPEPNSICSPQTTVSGNAITHKNRGSSASHLLQAITYNQ